VTCVCVHVQHFSDAIDACLKMAAKQGIKSIAFPVLGTSILLNYPDDFVASCMITVIERFCQSQPGKCADIRVVRYGDIEGIVSPCLNTHNHTDYSCKTGVGLVKSLHVSLVTGIRWRVRKSSKESRQ
jgi:hypothetical protein